MRLVATIAAVAAAAAAAVDTSDFRYTRTVHADAAAPIVIEPDGPMFAHARAGFADLRVLDANGSQVPWRRLPAPATASFEPVDVLNSGRQGDEAIALLDLGPGRVRRDRVELEVPDRGFVGRVVVLGSDRSQGPFTRLSTTGIYDVAGARRARSTTAVFPTTIYRYLLVRATGVSRITAARVSGSERRPELVPRPGKTVALRQEAARTIVVIDFGARNMPVAELRILAEGEYDRPILVEASNDRRTWRYVSSARLSRFPGSAPGPVALGTRARFVRLTIENGDDPPLTVIRTEASDRSHALVLENGHELPYNLLYGDPGRRAPDYEFARIPFSPSRRTVEGVLGPERANPEFEVPGPTFGERNRWLVSASLAFAALAVAAAGVLALRRRA